MEKKRRAKILSKQLVFLSQKRSIGFGISLPTQMSHLARVVLTWLLFAEIISRFRSAFLVLASVQSWQLTGGCAQRHHC
jgi:hypothetical protein